ncbi:MAG: Mrp/NBP35 family ATP-binding protein [Planctomycetes bacterium]|nr:Mrp/NBP35 family ATP-binding protein [Planctomycetota bacterium]
MNITTDQILNALRAVKDPDLHRDIVELGFVKDVKSCDGNVSLTIELTTPACPVREQMKQQAHQTVTALGAKHVDIKMTSQVRPTPTENRVQMLPNVKNIIPVASGKGGVGKSTVSANLALALRRLGAEVGLMDADVYGPSIPTIMGVKDPPQMAANQRMNPAIAHDVKIMSIGFFIKMDQAVVWRGPMLHKTVQQFLGGVEWGEIDYLVIDLPPGTGDVQLSLCQTIPLTGAAVVSTPQDVALNVAQKAIAMFRQLHCPILGIIENMSGYQCPRCGHHDDIFGAGGAKAAAERMNVPFLGAVPLSTAIRTTSDAGRPIVVAEPDSPQARAFIAAAESLAAQVSIRAFAPHEGVVQPIVWGKPE